MSSKQTNSDHSELTPARFILTPAQVAACFAKLDISPPALFAALPSPSRSLPGHVSRGKDKLTAEAEALFRLLAAPTQAINVNAYRPGSAVSIEARFAGSGSNGSYAMLSIDGEDQWDLALLTSRDQLLVILDDLGGLTAGPSQDTGFSLNLSLNALAALAAIADRLTEERLQSRLARRPDLASVAAGPIDLTDLVHMTELGLDRPDTRAVVTLMALASEGAIGRDRSLAFLEAGVQELGASGLVDEEGRITTVGLGLVSALTEARAVTSITVMVADGSEVTVDRLLLLRVIDGLLLGVWEGTPGRNESLMLSEVAAGTALTVIEDSLRSPELATAAPERKRAQSAKKRRARTKAASAQAAAPRARRSGSANQPVVVGGGAKRAKARAGASVAKRHETPGLAQSTRSATTKRQPTKSRPANPRHCVKCGAKLRRSAKFCTQCGHNA